MADFSALIRAVSESTAATAMQATSQPAPEANTSLLPAHIRSLRKARDYENRENSGKFKV